MPDNYEVSLERLKGLIQEQLDKRIIETAEQTTGRAHYLPHYTVVRCDKETTKVRIVYDASAQIKGPTLNDRL